MLNSVEQALAFFNTYFSGKEASHFLLIWNKATKLSRWFDDIERAAQYAVTTAGSPPNDLYIGTGLSAVNLGEKARGEQKDVAGIGGFWLDVDYLHDVHKKKNLPPTVEDAVEFVKSGPAAPTAIIHSGHGLQAWWIFDKVWTFQSDEERERAYQLSMRWQYSFKRLASERNWDVDSTFDLSRIFRIPGTFNYKTPDNAKPVHFIEFNPDTRYNVEDFARIIDALPAVEETKQQRVSKSAPAVIEAEQQKPNLDNSWPTDFTLRADADVAAMKLEALLTLDNKIKKTWERKRKDFQDQSASTYDFALANFAAILGWTNQEIVDLLVAFRRKHGEDLKLDVAWNYYSRTLHNVRSTLSDRAKQTAAINAETTSDREENLRAIKEAIRLPISRILKHMGTPPTYVIVLEDSREISIGTAANLLEQSKLRTHLFDLANFPLPRFKADIWDKILLKIAAIIEEVQTAEEATDKGAVAAWLHSYLVKKLRKTADPVAQRTFALDGEPAILNEQVHITLQDFKRHVETEFGERIGRNALSVLLTRLGCESKTVPIRTDATDSGMSSRSMFIVPNTVYERAVETQRVRLANQEQQHITATDFGEAERPEAVN